MVEARWVVATRLPVFTGLCRPVAADRERKRSRSVPLRATQRLRRSDTPRPARSTQGAVIASKFIKCSLETCLGVSVPACNRRRQPRRDFRNAVQRL